MIRNVAIALGIFLAYWIFSRELEKALPATLTDQQLATLDQMLRGIGVDRARIAREVAQRYYVEHWPQAAMGTIVLFVVFGLAFKK